MWFKCNGNMWSSIVDKCREKNIDLVDIIFHTKYLVNRERVFGFSEIEGTRENIEAALVLNDYSCDRVILSYIKPDLFTQDEWDYLIPYLEENNLLNREINMFYRDDLPTPRIIHVQTDTIKTWFFSSYYIRVVYRICNHTFKPPKEIEDLFVDDGACLNAIYVSDYL